MNTFTSITNHRCFNRCFFISISAMLLLFSSHSYAQLKSYRYQTYSLEDGMTQAVVLTLLQDRFGYIWMGTQDGLNRFDGKNFKVFKDTGKAQGLRGNYIRCMLEDPLGNLWIGTSSGLNLYHHRTDQFENFAHDANQEDSLSGNRITAMCLALDGRIWVGTETAGLSLFDPSTGKAQRFPANRQSFGPESSHVTSLFRDQKGLLWIGSTKGLTLYNEQTRAFRRFKAGPQEELGLPGPHVQCINDRVDGTLVIGFADNGIALLSSDFSRITYLQAGPNKGQLASNNIVSLTRDRNHNLWIGHYNAGLDLMKNNQSPLVHFGYSPLKPKGFPSNSIRSVMEDRSGLLWAGTFTEGVCVFNPNGSKFDLYEHHPTKSNSLSSDFVRAILLTKTNQLWVGTHNHGVSLFDRNKGIAKHFRNDPKNPKSLSNNEAISLLEDKKGQVWVGTKAGLNRYLPNDTFERIFADGKGGLSHNYISCLAETRDGYIWIGSDGTGFDRYDPQLKRYKNYTHDPKNPKRSLAGYRIREIIQDPTGIMWIGTFDEGFSRFDPKTETFHSWQHEMDNPKSLSNNHAKAFIYDQKGRFWVGTWGGGLNQLIPGQGDDPWADSSFIRYSEKDGLPGTVVSSMVLDEDGYIWMSSLKGISRMNPDDMTFEHYQPNDGLPSSGYNSGCYFKGHNGELFFGALKGMTGFFPKKVTPNEHTPPIYFTEFRKFNKPVDLPMPLNFMPKLELSYKDSVISFEVAGLDFNSPTQNRYAYKLEGFSDDWVDLENKSLISLTNLDSGNYTLYVKAANSDGIWNEEAAQMNIYVQPPPWKTIWAYAIYALIIALIILSYIRYNMIKIREERLYSQLLETKVQERTLWLQDRNKELATLEEITRVINLKVGTDQVLQALLEQGMILFPQADKAVAFRYHQLDGLFHIDASVGFDQSVLNKIKLSRQVLIERYMNPDNELEQGVFLIRQVKNLSGEESLGELPRPQSLLAMALHDQGAVEGFLVFDNTDNPKAFDDSDSKKMSRYKEHALTAFSKARIIEELVLTTEHLKTTRRQLVDAAHRAGLAEFSANVVHNIGNALNSLGVSTGIMSESLKKDRSNEFLSRLCDLIETQDNLAEFIEKDPRGKKIPSSLRKLSDQLNRFLNHLGKEIANLNDGVINLKEITDAQNEYSEEGSFSVETEVRQVIDDLLEIEATRIRENNIMIGVEIRPMQPIFVNRSKLLRVLNNLLINACEALEDRPTDRKIRIFAHALEQDQIRIELHDNGKGIPREDFARIFSSGYTTKVGGHGFGLHYCANTMTELHGTINVESRGEGLGTTFKLTIPTQANHFQDQPKESMVDSSLI